jgi:hypothetical protein
MFNNANIVEKINVDESQFILKIKDPQFHFAYPSYTCESNPIVIKTERNENNHINKTVFVIPYHPRYFHNMMEVFPMILTVLDNVGAIDVILTYEAEIDPGTGLFVTMIDNQPQPKMVGHCPVEKFPQLFVYDFFKYFNINLTCMNTQDLMYKSFDYCYLLYLRNESVDGKNFLYDEGKEFCKELEIEGFHPLFVGEVNPLYRFAKNLNLMRKHLPSSNIVKNQKIYISRKNFTDRNNPEESLLEEYFYNKQYKIVYLEKMNFYDQVKMVQESEKIVCMFGSALVNCMLGSELNSVISIRPINFQAMLYRHIFKMHKIKYTEIIYDEESLLELVKRNENMW